MALPSSGAISMSMVAAELGIANSLLNLNDSRVRSLAARPTGSISMADLRGKSHRQPQTLTIIGGGTFYPGDYTATLETGFRAGRYGYGAISASTTAQFNITAFYHAVHGYYGSWGANTYWDATGMIIVEMTGNHTGNPVSSFRILLGGTVYTPTYLAHSGGVTTLAYFQKAADVISFYAGIPVDVYLA